MALTHRLTITKLWTGSGNQTLTSSVVTTETSDAEQEYQVAVPIASDTTLDVAISSTLLKLIYILADKAMTLTPKDAAAAGAGSAIVLVANQAYTWTADDGPSNPFSADVATLHINSAAVGTLNIRVLQDATP